MRTAIAAVVVGAIASAFANTYRLALLWFVEWVFGSKDATVAARDRPQWVVVVSVTGGLVLATVLGRLARRRTENLGLPAIAAAARGIDTVPSFPGSLTRATGTWIAMGTMGSLGREAAISEVGGSFGATFARRLRLPVPEMTVAGVAAAFAAAYHAPLAGVVYVLELVLRKHGERALPNRRMLAPVVLGSAVGHLVSVVVFHRPQVFPTPESPLSITSAGHALVVAIPSLAAALLFLRIRKQLHAIGRSEGSRVETRRYRKLLLAPWPKTVILALVSGLVVSFVPLSAGNGMEAIRSSATGATVGVGFALLLGKLAATATALESGAPGGLFSPAMAVGAGGAILTFHAFNGLGLTFDGRWDAMIAAMAVAVAVATDAPFTAIVVVAELTGDYRAMPIISLAVGVALVIRHVPRRLHARALDRHAPVGGVAQPHGLEVDEVELDS